MGIIQRQTIKSTAYIYTGVLVGFVTTALVFPRVLTPSEIGAIGLLGSWSAVFAQFATLGFGGATVKFFPIFRDSKQNHQGFLFLLLSVTLGGFLIFLGLFFLLCPWLLQSTEESPLFQDYINLIIPFTLFQLFFLALDVYNRMLYNATTGTLLRELILRVFILIGISLFVLGLFRYQGFVNWYVGAQGAIAILLIFFLVWRGEFRPLPDFSLLDRPMLSKLGNLSLFSFLTGFSSLAIIRIDSIMIGNYLSDYDVGIYLTTMYFGTLVLLPSRALRSIAPTLISEAFSKQDLPTIQSIYHKSTITQLVVGLYLLLGLWVNTNTIFSILPQEFSAGQYVILFIGLANVVKMAGGMGDAIVGYSDYYRMNTVFNAGWLLLIILTNIIFIPKFGISGAAFASLVSVLVVTFVRFLFLNHKFKMQPYRIQHLWVLLLAIGTFGIVSFVPTLSPFWLDFLLRGTLVTLFFVLPVFFLNISPEINKIIIDGLQRLRLLI
ncbi:MAG: lipopolysaccharide biosynthesis protein [Cyclobacteriaceae bacterium]